MILANIFLSYWLPILFNFFKAFYLQQHFLILLFQIFILLQQLIILLLQILNQLKQLSLILTVIQTQLLRILILTILFCNLLDLQIWIYDLIVLACFCLKGLSLLIYRGFGTWASIFLNTLILIIDIIVLVKWSKVAHF